MQPSASLARNTLLYAGLCLLLVLFGFAYVLSFNLGWRAIFVMHAGILFLLGCGFFVRDLRSFLLFTMIFIFPMEFGYHLWFVTRPAGSELAEVGFFARGPRIDAADVLLIFLYIHWAFRLTHERLTAEPLSVGRPFGTVMLAWIMYVLLSGVVKAEQPTVTIFEVSVLFKGFLMFLYLANNLTVLRDFRIVYYALLADSVLLALLLSGQYLTGFNYDIHGEFSPHFVEREGFRSVGFTGCPDCSASMIDVVLPIALTQFLAEKNWLKRLGLVTCLGIMLAGLMTTKVRASLAAVVIVTLAVLTVGYLRQWISWKRMTLVIMAGLLLLIATAPLMVERFRTGAYGEDRMPLIYTALNMIKGNPMLGVGASNYAFRIDDYRPPEVAAAWVYVVHNEFLLRLAETGLIGFLLYYSLVGLAMIGLWRLTRTSDPWIFILSCGLLAAFVGSLPHRMLTTYYFESMFRMFCTLLALAFAMQRFERKQRAAE